MITFIIMLMVSVYCLGVIMCCSYDVHFWRQSLIMITISFHSVGVGFILSLPTNINAALLSSNSTDITATPDHVSWLTASFGLAGMVGFIFIPPIMQSRGRKTIFILLCILPSVGFVLLYFANNIITLFIGRILQGLSATGVTILVIIIAEFSHPTRRGYFNAAANLSLCLGSLVCHALYDIWTWRSIAALAATPIIISLLLTFLWPESPSYLAMKGKFGRCNASHTWLFGKTEESKDHFNALVRAQMERRNEKQNNFSVKLTNPVAVLGRKDFLFPLFVVILLTLLVDAFGRYYMLVYLIQIVTEITGDPSVAYYCSLIVDITMLLASSVSFVIVQSFSRRTILFVSGLCSSLLLYAISIITYLKVSYGISLESIWITPGLIILSTFISNTGAIPIAFTIIGEIFPLEHRGIGASVGGIVFTLLYAITMKIIPLMLETIGVYGVFAVFSTCIVVCLIILFFTLTETKDKTLQAIEDEIKGNKRSELTLLREVDITL